MPLDAVEDTRLGLGRDPVPGAVAVGLDCRDHPEFERLEAQIRVMEGAGANAADWTVVVQSAVTILRDQSKDLLVAAYLTYALWRQERLYGLAVGLSILRDITVLYWSDAFPPVRRTRARVSVFEWLNLRLAPLLQNNDVAIDRGSDALTARDALNTLDEALAERLGDAAPSLGDLIRAVRPLAERAEAQAIAATVQKAEMPRGADAPTDVPIPASSQPTAVVPPAAQAAPVAAPTIQPAMPAAAPVLTPPPALPEDVARALSPMREWLRGSALALLTANLTDPRGYGLLAQATWLPLDSLPAHDGGRTPLPPPSQDRLGDILSRRNGDAKDFILAIASFCSGAGLFWLDGQFMISQALKNLGSAASASAVAHENAVTLCLTPVAGVTALAFSDGTPFIAAAGRTWLDELLGHGSSGGSAPGEQPWLAGASAAQELVTANKAHDAFALLTEGAQTSIGQTKARWLVEALRLALRVNELAFGLALARRLVDLVAAHQLADWDADFAADILELAVRCIAAPEIGRFITARDREILMTQWSMQLSGLHITRTRDALKTFSLVT